MSLSGHYFEQLSAKRPRLRRRDQKIPKGELPLPIISKQTLTTDDRAPAHHLIKVSRADYQPLLMYVLQQIVACSAVHGSCDLPCRGWVVATWTSTDPETIYEKQRILEHVTTQFGSQLSCR